MHRQPSVFGLLLEVLTQCTELLVMRSYWERLWCLRATGLIHGGTMCEGFRAVRFRPHFIWLSGAAALLGWAQSNAIPTIVNIETGTGYSDKFGHQVSLNPRAGWLLIGVVVSIAQIIAGLVVAATSEASRDGMPSYGSKRMWIASGIHDATLGDTWGAPPPARTRRTGRFGIWAGGAHAAGWRLCLVSVVVGPARSGASFCHVV